MPIDDSSAIDGLTIRPMREADVRAGMALVVASRWNQTEREWRLFLDVAPGRAIVAERGGRVVGTAVTVPYAPDTAWIAMVLVDPAERGRGIGRALLTRAMALAPEGHVPRLDATPAGRALYLTLGFEDEGTLARWRCASRSPDHAVREGVRPLDPRDWPALVALDREVTGIDRARVLAWCREGAPDLAWTTAHGPSDGYVLGRHGRETDHIGPVMASSASHAIALVDACLTGVTSPTVTIDVPDGQVALTGWLAARGFALERPFTRMRRGAACGRLPRELFAIAGPELG